METAIKDEVLSLKNYKIFLPKELQKLVLKNTVRECDENEKNSFQAYVDEGAESYDVSLVFSNRMQVEQHTCDCTLKVDFCRHKAALLIHIAEVKKIPTLVKAKAKAKASKSEAMLDDIDVHQLKEWVRVLLSKNKDIELAFINKFSQPEHAFTIEEAKRITTEVIKAVVKNKTNLDPTEVKKITQLWADVHEPIVSNYHNNITDEHAFAVFHSLLNFCTAFHEKIKLNTNKITKYTEGLLQSSVAPIASLELDEVWLTACRLYIKKLQDTVNVVNMPYLLHLKNVMAIADKKRYEALIALLAHDYKQLNEAAVYNLNAYTSFLFALVKEKGLDETYCDLFQPIRFDNVYNIELINLLIAGKKYDRAEKFCHSQIAANYQDQFNIPYLTLLKEIYTHTGNDTGLLKVLKTLFPLTFHFNDFVYIYEHMKDEEEKKKWRTKMLTKSRGSISDHLSAAREFGFHLLNREGKYAGMLEHINEKTPYHIINQYFEPMYVKDKLMLLKAIISKGIFQSWFRVTVKEESDTNCFSELAGKMMTNYDPKNILSAISNHEKNRFSFHRNPFLEFLKQAIAANRQ